MLILHFHIHYKTQWDQQPFIHFERKKGKKNIEGQFNLQSFDGENWTGQLILEPREKLQYRYGIQNDTNRISEFKRWRNIPTTLLTGTVYIKDFWRAQNEVRNIFHTSAFTEVIFKRNNFGPQLKNSLKKLAGNGLQFKLWAANVPQTCYVGITGNVPELGHWKKAQKMTDLEYPNWTLAISGYKSKIEIEYKYVLCDIQTDEIVQWEVGDNRLLVFSFPENEGYTYLQNDDHFRYSKNWWKGAGMAIPVFSLRSATSLGMGEFVDLIHAIDFCKDAGLKMLQILPVNDTIANKTWKDSYPYSAISVFALQPLYIHIPSIGSFKTKKLQKGYEDDLKRLNALTKIDFVDVMNTKFKYFRMLFDQDKDKLKDDKDFQNFITVNQEWLKPYAVFCYLRDFNNTSDFREWNKYNTYNPSELEILVRNDARANEEIHFYYYLQYHADKQLIAAKDHGRKKGVVLKGDLPIGIYRYSCDAWVSPSLYNINEQSGAPPDDYAEAGQNWGFPTYNWEEMSKDGFSWWQKRMAKLSEYFDALRIDHILGFFRIWSIPIEAVEGTMGLFNPRLPYSTDELVAFGIKGDINRYISPYIRKNVVEEVFGSEAKLAVSEFMDEVGHDAYVLKDKCNTQAKIKAFCARPENKVFIPLEKSLIRLVGEILLIEEEVGEKKVYNPRITLHKTFSYKALDDDQKEAFDKMYNDYFYSRHDQFWKKQALWKLPALLEASNMLICGEDLGMIPSTVPEVMRELNIIPLEIQRMPKVNTRFGSTGSYDYLSVASPSCHDMSTIRGWWEENKNTAIDFYYNYMGQHGSVPEICHREIVEFIVRDHIMSPAILAIFPIQDLLGMDDELKHPDPFSEQINEPSNPDHYWRYRMHLDIESISKKESFVERLRNAIKYSGRDIS